VCGGIRVRYDAASSQSRMQHFASSSAGRVELIQPLCCFLFNLVNYSKLTNYIEIYGDPCTKYVFIVQRDRRVTFCHSEFTLHVPFVTKVVDTWTHSELNTKLDAVRCHVFSSVCPWHASIVPKRLNVSTKSFHRLIAPFSSFPRKYSTTGYKRTQNRLYRN